MLIQKVASYITQNHLIRKHDHIIVALSGGRDSIALLHMLIELKSTFAITLSAVHVNHGLRGKESDQDEKFVRKICKGKNISCVVERLAGFSLQSGENALRKARYALFGDLLLTNKAAKIATAHHVDDQLETFLMRLLKGSGPAGLLAIAPKRDGFIRPFLGCTRSEITQYCLQHKLNFREDSSNAQIEKQRNRIRHNLIPQIKNIFGENYLLDFNKAHIDYARLYHENLKANHALFKKMILLQNEHLEISCSRFKKFSFLQKQQFLEYCFSELKGLTSRPDVDHMRAFDNFIDHSGTGKRFIFAPAIEVLKNRDNLIFYRQNDQSSEIADLFAEEVIKFDSFYISVSKTTQQAAKLSNDPATEYINGDLIHFPLQVRNWQKGDFFYPLGSNKKQKVSDFFINNKISRDLKSRLPLVLNNSEIIWIAGYRLSDLYKITKETRLIYKLEIKYTQTDL